MRAQGVVGLDRFGDEIGALAFFARVFDRAKVRIGPAVKRAVFDTGEIVRDEIVAEQVAFIDDGPESLGSGFPIHADGIAQPSGKYPHAAAVGIDFDNARAPLIFFPSVFFVDVGCRADGDINFLARRIGAERARVMAAGRQIENLFAFAVDLRLAAR